MASQNVFGDSYLLKYSSIPLRALRPAAANKLSTMLNCPKFIPTDQGVMRDWHGLAEMAGADSDWMRTVETKPDPLAEVIQFWSMSGTFAALIQGLEQMDRFDVLEDCHELLLQDGEHFIQNGLNINSLVIDNGVCDDRILTVADSRRLNEGLDVQTYDAYLLYSDDDAEFAMEIVNKLENDYGLQLCLRDRDLIGGVPFEHNAIARLIKERCKRLIVVFSPSFVHSEGNKFLLSFAQALGIEQRERKIIPCIFKECDLPASVRYSFCLYYNRSGKLWNFWEKLRDSLKTTPAEEKASSVTSTKRASQIHSLFLPFEHSVLSKQTTPDANSSSPELRLPSPPDSLNLLEYENASFKKTVGDSQTSLIPQDDTKQSVPTSKKSRYKSVGWIKKQFTNKKSSERKKYMEHAKPTAE